MSNCYVKFRSPISKQTVNSLAIEFLKYVLYYRGQFPLPLDQLKKSIANLEKSEISHVCLDEPEDSSLPKYSVFGDVTVLHDIQQDGTPQCLVNSKRPSFMARRSEQQFFDFVKKFDMFFQQLQLLLETTDVSEIVLNLGSNIMLPVEMYHIKLPSSCNQTECSKDCISFQRCKLQFFQTVVSSNIFSDVSSEKIMPISFMLLLPSKSSLAENMELKRFYTIPKNRKIKVINFHNYCDHKLKEDQTYQQIVEEFEKLNTSETAEPISGDSSSIWVKLKPDLKGFTSYI